MGDSAAASLLAESSSMAPSTLERATLTRRTREQGQNSHHASVEREVPKQTIGQGESGVFWGLVIILLLVAGGNLLLTFFVMGVLRLGYGMESVEFIPGERVTKFFGHTDLGNIYKRDGIIYGYNDVPFAIEGDDSKVSFGLRSKNSPTLEVGPEKIAISGVDSVKVTFTLFSSHDSMTKSAKEKLTVKLSETEKPDSYRKGKPVFPVINAATVLTDLVGPESHFLFDDLGVECDWLTTPADTWEDNDSYRNAQKFVRSVKVTNDVAERGVKLMSDFATQITTDPEQRSCLLQVVEYHRNKFDSFKKAT